MKALLIVLTTIIVNQCAISFASAESKNLIHDRRVENQRDCFSQTFSDFNSWRSAMKKKYEKRAKNTTQASVALQRFDGRFNQEKFDFYRNNIACRTFSYPVDGERVNGFVIKPKHANQDLPVLVYNRGGNGDFGSVVFGSMMANLFPLANEGFIIIGSQYRGTFNHQATLQDEFGGEDVKDVTALFGYIANIEGSDPLRLGMFGASRGGMQTFLALKHAPYIKAVATIAGPSDLQALLKQRPNMENVYRRRIPNYADNKKLELEKRSVLRWVDQLPQNVPILLLHGKEDKRVDVDHSVSLADALSAAKMPHKLVLYPKGNHTLSQNRGQANEELVSWFRKYL